MAVGPRAPFGAPDWKPFLNLRGTSLSERVRPEPVVFLRLAFSPQLSATCVSICATGGMRWYRVASADEVSCPLAHGCPHTLSNAGAWVSAVGASVLLHVHRATACIFHNESALAPIGYASIRSLSAMLHSPASDVSCFCHCLFCS